MSQPLTEVYKFKLKNRAAIASVCVAFLLFSIKTTAWIYTDSVSLLSSIVDSFIDGIASLFNMVAIRYAMRPADKEHRFGHGKFEAISAFAQAIFIVMSAFFVLREAIERLVNPQPISDPWLGVFVIVISIGITFLLVFYQQYVIRQTNSIAIHADSTHYKMDLYLNLSVIGSIVLTYYYDMVYVDPIVGVLIIFYIIYTAFSLFKSTLQILTDREIDDADKQTLIKIFNAHPEVKGFHQLRTRSSGSKHFIQVHLEMEGEISLKKAHSISHDIENAILKAFPHADVLIHQDPVGLNEPHALEDYDRTHE